MSDTPGPNPHPRDRRRGDRPRKRKPRGERRHADGERWQREGRHRRRQRGRPAPAKPPAPPPKLSLRQKLIRILTLGLMQPGKAAAARPPQKDPAPPLPALALAAAPPVDLETITGPRLFVGNLHYRAEERDLLDLFKGIGPVASVDVVYDGSTYQSKGCGFVEFMKAEDARRAVEELHGLPFFGRPLLLGPAEPRGEDARERDVPA
jgi:RNA recognition motif. (a.k.a. RRM, RBD, or RNP domain)